MRSLIGRREPTIDPVVPIVDSGLPDTKTLLRAPRHAPTGDLTRAIRRDQSRDQLARIRAALDLSVATFEAISVELLSDGGPLLGDRAVEGAMRALYDFEPVGAMTSHPVILVGGTPEARMRAVIAMSQRIERAGRRIALYSLRSGVFAEPVATCRGGLDILHIGSVEACIDAVRVKEPAELAIVEASCLDEGRNGEPVTGLPMLTLALSAEAIYLDDGQSPMPDADRLSGIERVILAGPPRPDRFGGILDAAYRYGWAFAGQCSAQGIWHPMTATMLADRFALAIR